MHGAVQLKLDLVKFMGARNYFIKLGASKSETLKMLMQITYLFVTEKKEMQASLAWALSD